MSTFILYIRLGYRHILDIYSVDHMLFIIALLALYLLRDWKKVLFLFSFYAVGNSISLALSVKRIIVINMDIIEYLIPLTIFIAAISNIFKKHHSYLPRNPIKFFIAGFFGLIHGFGFANYLNTFIGNDVKIAIPLAGFNIGVELGLLLIAFIYLFITWIFVNNLGISRKDWNLVVSSSIAGVALTLMFESRYWL